MLNLTNKTIIISRTDSIGDVCLTLPLCGFLKKHFQGIRIVFLGNRYTEPVLQCCPDIDEIISWDDLKQKEIPVRIQIIKAIQAWAIIHVFPNKEVAELAKKSGIPQRIGTSHRIFHWFTCNHRVGFTRKNSLLHESQLNFHLLRPFGIKEIPDLSKVNSYVRFYCENKLPEWIEKELKPGIPAVLLHPKSKGSALEWGIHNFISLAKELTEKGCKVIFTGTDSEALAFRHLIPDYCLDTTGKLSLTELIGLINRAEIMVAASTGPLHIAGLFNRITVGIFSSRRPIHPGRWKPLGNHSVAVVYDPDCADCRKGKPCKCIEKIPAGKIVQVIGNKYGFKAE